MGHYAYILFSLVPLLFRVSAEQCGSQAGGELCHGGLCCSKFGWCGNNADYCGDGCQSQCSSSPSPPNPTPSPPPNPPSPPGSGGEVASLIPKELFEQMLLHRNENVCPAKGFYTYEGFIAATKTFPQFASVGDTAIRKREIAAFLAQTSHETTGGWDGAPDGRFSWGYCYLEETGSHPTYCTPSAEWPCAPGKSYHGRGPIQISYNYNYGQAGRAISVDILNNPDLVAQDPTISFDTAFWFWMTPQAPKPSCHDVITGVWTPSAADTAANRLPGFGVTTNIINGGEECGKGSDERVNSRIGFFKRYCDLLGVSYGENLDCGDQRHFASGFESGLSLQKI